MSSDAVVIVSLARTPIGNFLGELKAFSANELGAQVIAAAVKRAGLSPQSIDEVMMGCVLPAGQGQAPARQAALKAGLPDHVSCTTLNKVCGSGMKAVMLAAHEILIDTTKIMVAGGMESMTQAPYLLNKARQGYRLGHAELLDHMMLDGLQDAYGARQAMGFYAEQCAQQHGLTRQQQDVFALSSFERAQAATRENRFSEEMIPLTVSTKAGEQLVTKDERPFSVNLEKLLQLPSAFVQEGSVTAGNSSSIADGAAALVLMHGMEAEKRGLQPLARIIGQSACATEPSKFTVAPITAVKRLLEKVKWEMSTVDLFEINEAFAVVTLAAMQGLGIPREKVNIHGGACALGHPIGASGARMIVTLLAALKMNHLKRGVATLCIGGGEATAIALERCG